MSTPQPISPDWAGRWWVGHSYIFTQCLSWQEINLSICIPSPTGWRCDVPLTNFQLCPSANATKSFPWQNQCWKTSQKSSTISPIFSAPISCTVWSATALTSNHQNLQGKTTEASRGDQVGYFVPWCRDKTASKEGSRKHTTSRPEHWKRHHKIGLYLDSVNPTNLRIAVCRCRPDWGRPCLTGSCHLGHWDCHQQVAPQDRQRSACCSASWTDHQQHLLSWLCWCLSRML